MAHHFKQAAPETPVVLTVHELKRLARNAAELMTLSADLQAAVSSSNCSPVRSPASTTPRRSRANHRRRSADPARPRPHPPPRRPDDTRGNDLRQRLQAQVLDHRDGQ
ncbi:hypothetical protein OG563_43675 [Nocardia vinacea]|uniref:Uncharacterized protein n=1 Tax=Nocardia vinacea TaxID=96468 RepID=A0ABZ1ZBH0_9NOCA